MTTNYEVNLVEKDYYPKGLKYQTRIDAIENAREINAIFLAEQTNDSIIITTPEIMVDSGSIMFFRPSGSSLDKTYDLVINKNNKLNFSLEDFIHGKYLLKTNWFFKDKEYYVEQPLFIK